MLWAQFSPDLHFTNSLCEAVKECLVNRMEEGPVTTFVSNYLISRGWGGGGEGTPHKGIQNFRFLKLVSIARGS